MVLIIYTPDEVLAFGLKLYGYDDPRLGRQTRKTNVADFKSHFGTYPSVLAQIWEDLQTTHVAAARINTATPKGMVCLETFLRAMSFLKYYPIERQRKGPEQSCQNTIRKYTWYFLERVQALKAMKVRSCDQETSLRFFASIFASTLISKLSHEYLSNIFLRSDCVARRLGDSFHH